MTIFVDQIKDWGSLGKWCHMLSDAGTDELHEFAKRLGAKRSWFQKGHGPDHYDLTPSMRRQAIALGAQQATVKDIGRLLRRWREGCTQDQEA